MKLIDKLFRIQERIDAARAEGVSQAEKMLTDPVMLWKKIFLDQFPEPKSEQEAMSVWSSVFFKTPELLDYLKKREITLLKTMTLKDKSQDFVLGQIAENRLWQHFEPKPSAFPKAEPQPQKKLITVDKFLARWQKKKGNADTGKEEKNVDGSGVSRSEAQPAAHSGEDQKKEG
jgi:hypothetical protein